MGKDIELYDDIPETTKIRMIDDMCKCECHKGEPIFCQCCDFSGTVWCNEDGSVNWVRYNLLLTRARRSKEWMKKRGYNKEQRGE